MVVYVFIYIYIFWPAEHRLYWWIIRGFLTLIRSHVCITECQNEKQCFPALAGCILISASPAVLFFAKMFLFSQVDM